MSSEIPGLSSFAQRVLGCLVEKEALTPEAYPLSLNGVVVACNQKTAREPVMEVGEGSAYQALRELETRGLARRIEAPRTTKWRHLVREAWSLEAPELAVLALLLLRGPQTSGEIRNRSERLHTFHTPEEVEASLARLSQAENVLVRDLGRGPGQKEGRWAHALGPAGERSKTPTVEEAELPSAVSRGAESDRTTEELARRLSDLEERVSRIEQALGRRDSHEMKDYD